MRFAGLRLIRAELQEFLLRGGEMRVIASVYTGSTEKRALDELVGLGAKVKCHTRRPRRACTRKPGCSSGCPDYNTAYVGSSNLTHSALLDGLEWNVRATQVDNPAILQRVAATFEQYWHEPEFEPYDPQIDGERLQDALDAQKGSGDPGRHSCRVDVQPKPFQVEILEALNAERQPATSAISSSLRPERERPGSPPSTTSAFAVPDTSAYCSLLTATRSCGRAKGSSASVLGDADFGERHIGAERPVRGTHVFASIQSLSRSIEQFDPTSFDVVIIDEFHHAEAPPTDGSSST